MRGREQSSLGVWRLSVRWGSLAHSALPSLVRIAIADRTFFVSCLLLLIADWRLAWHRLQHSEGCDLGGLRPPRNLTSNEYLIGFGGVVVVFSSFLDRSVAIARDCLSSRLVPVCLLTGCVRLRRRCFSPCRASAHPFHPCTGLSPLSSIAFLYCLIE